MTEIAQRRPASARWGVGESVVALVGFAWIALAAFWAAPAILYVDGLLYQGMIDAVVRNGSLFIGNGYPEYRSEALILTFTHPSEAGLAPQYPGGWGILAAPAYALAGVRGVIVLNALASAMTLGMVWLAARALLEDRRLAIHAALIYGLATFAVDHAFGISPHAMSTFLVAAAIAAAAHGWRAGGNAELGGAFLAGLALGIAINARVGALIVAAPLGVWLLGAGRRPYAAAGMLLLGLAPGLAAATAINYTKFGILSPLSYGGSGGATSLGAYARLVPLAGAGALAALALGIGRVRAAVYRPVALAIAAAGLGALLLALPPTRELLLRLASGFWVLVVDFQAVPLPGKDLALNPDGTISASGNFKKALLQSMPYAAAVLVLIPRLVRGPERAGLALCLLICALVVTPFAFLTWHGGTSKNMRYFLNLLPALAILGAVALDRVGKLARARPAPAAERLAVLAVIGGGLAYGFLRGYSPGFVVEVTLANAIALAATALAVTVLVARGAAQGIAASALRGVMIVGLVAAFCSAWLFDLRVTQSQRASNLAVWSTAGDLPADALVVTYFPDFVPFRLNRPPALTAEADVRTLTVGPALAALVERAFAENRPVIAQSRHLAAQLVELGLSSGFAPRYGLSEFYAFHDMRPPAAGATEPR